MFFVWRQLESAFFSALTSVGALFYFPKKRADIFIEREVYKMGKHLVFVEADKALIAKITEYQKAHGLTSFVSAVRKLCKDALEIEKIRH